MGENPEFEAFYRDSFQVVASATAAFCGDRDVAFESTQEAFARAFARWRKVGSFDWPQAWVMTTAFNLCRKHFRQRSRREPTAPLPKPPDTDRVELLHLIGRLPERQRQALLLHYIADLPVSGVAVLMNVSEGAVKAHLFKARKALRDVLEVDHA